jgi:hypothetical protein
LFESLEQTQMSFIHRVFDKNPSLPIFSNILFSEISRGSNIVMMPVIKHFIRRQLGGCSTLLMAKMSQKSRIEILDLAQFMWKAAAKQ